MGIDRIGKPKGPGAGVPTGASGVSGASGVDKFRVESRKTESVNDASPIGQLQSGKIGVDQYLDVKVEQATQHLEGKLPVDKLQWIRETLRSQMEKDPMLAEMVKRVSQGVKASTNDSGR